MQGRDVLKKGASVFVIGAIGYMSQALVNPGQMEREFSERSMLTCCSSCVHTSSTHFWCHRGVRRSPVFLEHPGKWFTCGVVLVN